MQGFFFFGFPADSTQAGTKRGAARKAVGIGPAGEDLYFEIDAIQPDNAVGNVLVSVPYQALPTSDYEDIIASDVAVELLLLSNTTDEIRTVSVRTKAGSPLPVLTDFPIGPGITPIPLVGVEITDGLEWKAGGAGVYGAFKGYASA